MSVTEGDLGGQPGSDSFWEVGGYKNVLKRCDDGPRLCSELANLVQERADIEKHYAKSLKEWSKKWSKFLESGSEYGTSKSIWLGNLSEAESLADIHLEMKDNLVNKVQVEVKSWKTENYQKAMMGGLKQTKAFEEKFKTAQKPWAKKMSKVQKTKKDYHTACKNEKSASVQESNAQKDSALPADQLKKAQEKAEKSRNEVRATKEAYQAALEDLNACNAKYMEDTNLVFVDAQNFEKNRLQFFKKIFGDVQNYLNISSMNSVPQIYAQFAETIRQADSQMDLKLWSRMYGADMAMNWPTFEEYSQELHSISRKKNANPDPTGVTLTAMQKAEPNRASYATPSASPPTYQPPQAQQPTNGGSNRYSYDDFDDDPPSASDHAVGGVKVKALYDYVGQEEDELSFKAGEVFQKTRDKDDQGWCTGFKDGKSGLYPDSYAQALGY